MSWAVRGIWRYRFRVRFSGVCPVVVVAAAVSRCRDGVVVGLCRILGQKRSRSPNWFFRSRGLRGRRGGGGRP